MRLAGTYHPIEYILLRLEFFFPTLENVGAIYLSEEELNYIINGDKQEIEVFDQVNLQKIRSKRSFTFDWTASPNLLDTPVYSKQNSLYDEEKNTTLLIYLPSEKRDFCDVLILTFPRNQVMKGTKDVFSGISTAEKSLIATFSLNILKSEYERIQAEKSIIEGFSHVQKRQLQKIDQLNHSLEETKKLYLTSLQILISEYFERLSKEYECTFVPSDDLIEKIAHLQLGIDDIYFNLRSAADLGYHLLFGEQVIKIPASYITSNESQFKQLDIQSNKSDKVFYLLNRYEFAAEFLRDKSLPINGKNVAKHLDPPVTPPAITDAVKKNEKRIQFLLNQYTEKWPLIRINLKPIERLNDSRQRGNKIAV